MERARWCCSETRCGQEERGQRGAEFKFLPFHVVTPGFGQRFPAYSVLVPAVVNISRCATHIDAIYSESWLLSWLDWRQTTAYRVTTAARSYECSLNSS
ncbi:hypothetical protein LshimejAT787_1900990 [Lyophyllum shimeji]|uniref:Uncharacterized protein n=1 Tax=Lyophyllum shimeji TaxID=47721 RepID=A0A9P3Q0I1_LYOSH|nr:hypothetical protein LshimejAT787_1900990 [Lyophyllum shimeji]